MHFLLKFSGQWLVLLFFINFLLIAEIYQVS